MIEKNNQNKKTYTETEVVAMLKEIKKELDVLVAKIAEVDKKMDKRLLSA